MGAVEDQENQTLQGLVSTCYGALQAAMTAVWHLPTALLSASTYHKNTEIEMNNRTKGLLEHALCCEQSATLHFTLPGSQQGSGTLIIEKLKGISNALCGQSSSLRPKLKAKEMTMSTNNGIKQGKNALYRSNRVHVPSLCKYIANKNCCFISQGQKPLPGS